MAPPAVLRACGALALTGLLLLTACSGDETSGPTALDDTVIRDGSVPIGTPGRPGDPGDPGDRSDDPDPPQPVWPAELLDASHLVTDLFGWPEQQFGRGNNATIQIFRGIDDPAVDFTLRDVSGTAHSLADLLVERPVLLVQGSYT